MAQTVVMNRDAQVEKAVAQTRAQDEERMATPFPQVGDVAVTDERATAQIDPRVPSSNCHGEGAADKRGGCGQAHPSGCQPRQAKNTTTVKHRIRKPGHGEYRASSGDEEVRHTVNLAVLVNNSVLRLSWSARRCSHLVEAAEKE